MENIKKLVGDRIRDLRKERGMSQEDLGAKADLHYTYIGAVERGEKNCSIITLGKIAAGLNVELVDLVSFSASSLDLARVEEAIITDIKLCSPDALRLVSDLVTKLKAKTPRQ